MVRYFQGGPGIVGPPGLPGSPGARVSVIIIMVFKQTHTHYCYIGKFSVFIHLLHTFNLCIYTGEILKS